MIVQLGLFQFNTDFGYNALEKIREWNWESVDIIGDDPILHYSGRTREISFEGDYWTYQGDADRPEDLATWADNGGPLSLTDDKGNFYGFWVIVSLSRAERHFRANQKLGLETRWQLRLKYYGETQQRGA